MRRSAYGPDETFCPGGILPKIVVVRGWFLLTLWRMTVDVPPVPSPQTTFIDASVKRLYLNRSGLEAWPIILGLNPPEVPLGPIVTVMLSGGFSSQETVALPVESRGVARKAS